MRVLFAIMFFATRASAQEAASDPRAVQPERPTVATHAYTVAPGYVEIEAGAQGDRLGRGSRAYQAPIVTKFGIGSHVQLNLTTPFVFASAGQRASAGDVALGLKWRLLDGSRLLGAFAVLPSVKFATGSAARGSGTGTTDIGVTAISSRHIGVVAVDLNATYTRLGAGTSTPAADDALWTASFGFPLHRRLGAVAELFGAPTIDGSARRSTAALLIGPTFLVRPALNVDAGVIAPLRGDVPHAIYAGVVWNLGRLRLPVSRSIVR
jgi:hypothetical protein